MHEVLSDEKVAPAVWVNMSVASVHGFDRLLRLEKSYINAVLLPFWVVDWFRTQCCTQCWLSY